MSTTYAPINGFSETGAQSVVTAGINSSTLVQGSYPFATIAVYLHATTSLASIFSDEFGTPLTNPFTANDDGSWVFWAANGTIVDVQMSGGEPPFPAPITLVGLYAGNGNIPSFAILPPSQLGPGVIPPSVTIPINQLAPAIGANTIDNTNNRQWWRWELDGTLPTTGLSLGEVTPSTNVPSFGMSALVDVYVLEGSTVPPFKAVANVSPTNTTGTGLVVDPNGNIILNGLPNESTLGTTGDGTVVGRVIGAFNTEALSLAGTGALQTLNLRTAPAVGPGRGFRMLVGWYTPQGSSPPNTAQFMIAGVTLGAIPAASANVIEAQMELMIVNSNVAGNYTNQVVIVKAPSVTYTSGTTNFLHGSQFAITSINFAVPNDLNFQADPPAGSTMQIYWIIEGL